MKILEYPKINTIWKRESEKPRLIIPGEYTRPEFETVTRWHVSEKINGTNVRIIWDGTNAEFRGKTDKAQLPSTMFKILNDLFPVDKLARQFTGPCQLFGEAFGQGIQAEQQYYGAGQNFALFDALIDGWWLEPDAINDLADQMNIVRVPYLGVYSTDEAIYIIEDAVGDSASALVCSFDPNQKAPAEGIVCRSVPQLFNRYGERVMWKLKLKDYCDLARCKG